LEIIAASSSLFDNEQRFPAGTAVLDSVLVMRKVSVAWRPLTPMTVCISSA
jgi:hypothetical protein